jgi:hypothetical protein
MRVIFHTTYPGKPRFFAGKAWFLKTERITNENEGVRKCAFAKGEKIFLRQR